MPPLLALIASISARFATDSPLEGDGFEPSVPRQRKPLVEAASFARDCNRERTAALMLHVPEEDRCRSPHPHLLCLRAG